MAHEHHHDDIEPPGEFEVPEKFKLAAIACAVVGVLAFFGGLFLDAERAWRGYVIGFWFTFSVALCGPFFVATQYISKAGWSVSIRRIPEAMGAFLYPAVLLGIGALIGAEHVFGWIEHAEAALDPDHPFYDPIVVEKEAVLNFTALIVVTVGSTLLLAGMYYLMRTHSLRQDEEGGHQLTRKNIWTCAGFIIVFVITVSFMSWYWTMSFDPHWYSMMWSVYAFAGLFQTGLALMTLILIYLLHKNLLGGTAGMEQVHRMGQFVFAFTVFYAYIHFSQFMLLWYANIPETAKWYVDRAQEGWLWLMLAIPLFKFIIPFFTLLPQAAKKNKHNILVYVCVLLIVMQVYEIWLWIAPYTYGPEVGLTAPMVPWLELLVVLGFVGLFALVVSQALARNNLVPLKDPFLHESIPHSHDHLIYPNGKPGEAGDDDHS